MRLEGRLYQNKQRLRAAWVDFYAYRKTHTRDKAIDLIGSLFAGLGAWYIVGWPLAWTLFSGFIGLLLVSICWLAFFWIQVPRKTDYTGDIRAWSACRLMAVYLPVIVIGIGSWYLYRSFFPNEIEWKREPASFGLLFNGANSIGGFLFKGKNVSGHSIYQINPYITIDYNHEIIPLYIVAPREGQWLLPRDTQGIPENAEFNIGCQIRDEGLHCNQMKRQMTIDQFLIDIGAFEFNFTYDGKMFRHHFTTDELREQISDYRHQHEESLKNNPLLQPSVTRRRTAD